jgi:hypothetical protein
MTARLLDLFCGVDMWYNSSCHSHAGARFVFSSNSRLSVSRSHDCDKHEKQQVGGSLIRGTMVAVICLNCGREFTAQRRTRKFCSCSCANRANWASEKYRNCRHCGNSFALKSAADANRKYCSQKCSKKAYQKQQQVWKFTHATELKEYFKVKTKESVESGKEKTRRQLSRLEAIRLLGGKCVVCEVTNPLWLHIDYKPTTRNLPFRHPRHLKYIREHLSDFRLLCANHHYELTLTGKIEGTEITQ